MAQPALQVFGGWGEGGKGVHKPFPCLPFLSPSGDLVVELVRDIHPIRPSAIFSVPTCSKPFNTDLKRSDQCHKLPQIAQKCRKSPPHGLKSAPNCLKVAQSACTKIILYRLDDPSNMIDPINYVLLFSSIPLFKSFHVACMDNYVPLSLMVLFWGVPSPPPILHLLYSDTTHLIPAVHLDWTFEAWNFDSFHALAIEGLRVVNCPTRWSLLLLIGYWCRSSNKMIFVIANWVLVSII